MRTAVRSGDVGVQPVRYRTDVDALDVSPAWHKSQWRTVLGRRNRGAVGGVIVKVMATDVTDATFETDVLERSTDKPVVVDLWAPWCGPCRTLGPILEKVVDETDDTVELVKVNVDENPGVAAAFRVQSIPAVFAIKDQGCRRRLHRRPPRDPGPRVASAVCRRRRPKPTSSSPRATRRRCARRSSSNPVIPWAVVALAELLAEQGNAEEALALLARIPETAETRRVAALARTGPVVADDGTEAKLDALLARVKDDEAARQEFVDLLELLGPDDPRTAHYRRRLTSALF